MSDEKSATYVLNFIMKTAHSIRMSVRVEKCVSHDKEGYFVFLKAQPDTAGSDTFCVIQSFGRDHECKTEAEALDRASTHCSEHYAEMGWAEVVYDQNGQHKLVKPARKARRR